MAITKVTEGVRTLGTGEVLTANMDTDPTNASNLSSGDVPLAQLGNVDTSGITANQDDIALLGFKVAANGSLARYNLVDQSIDAFEDASGVDASASTNEVRHSSNYYSGVTSGGNYWGDESDGAVTISVDTNLTVPSKNGSYDGDMYVANFANLTIDASVTLSTDQPTRGMLIYVDGDCVINGALSMTARGGFSNPTTSGGSDSSAVNASGLQLGLLTSGGSQTFAWIGSGQGGGRIAKAFYDLGYHKTVAVNTAKADLALLELPDDHK